MPICTLGNISNIQGPAKSAKSTVLGAMVAAVLKAMLGGKKGTHDWTETLYFSSDAPDEKEGKESVILHFDTEQSPYDHHGQVMRMLARAGVDGINETANQRLYSYSLVEFDITERFKAIVAIIDKLRADKYVLCIFLDGVADIVSDPNDSVKSFDMVAQLHRMAANRDQPCAIITVLHENPGGGKDGSSKTRGHLGSQIERKSECNLRVVKDNEGETSTIWVEKARRAHIPRSEGVGIQWVKDPVPPHLNSRHVLVTTTGTKGTATNKEQTKSADPSKLIGTPKKTPLDRERDFLDTVLKTPMSHKVLLEMTTKRFKLGIFGAKARVSQWKKKGWIHKGDGKTGLYGLHPPQAPSGAVSAIDGTITPTVAEESGSDETEQKV